MKRIRVIGFFVLLLMFVMAITLLSVSRFGNITGFAIEKESRGAVSGFIAVGMLVMAIVYFALNLISEGHKKHEFNVFGAKRQTIKLTTID